MSEKENKDGKRPIEMTTDEVVEKLFPKEVIDEAKKVAHEKDDKEDEKNGKSSPT